MRTKNRLALIGVVTVFLLAVTVCYWHTLLGWSSLSRFGLLPDCDAFFSQQCLNFENKADFDVSLFLLLIPYQIFNGLQLGHFQLPLWNDLVGCGLTVIGNISAKPLSPICILFPPTNLYLHNSWLLLELFLSGLGVALLGRTVGLSLSASVFSGLGFLYCPLILREFELDNNYWIYPWVILVLLKAQKQRNFRSILVASLLVTFAIATSHIECSFFAIIFGSVFAIIMSFSDTSHNGSIVASSKPTTIVSRIYGLLGPIAITGIITAGLSAPVLVPFLEYLHNGYLYKTDSPTAWSFDCWTFITSMVHPVCGWDSVTLGTAAFFLMLVALFSRTRTANSLIAAGILPFLFVTRAFPFDRLLTNQPLVGLYPLYCVPVVAIVALLLAGTGLDITGSTSSDKRMIQGNEYRMLLAAALIVSLFFLFIPSVALQPEQRGSMQLFFRVTLGAEPAYYRVLAAFLLLLSALIAWLVPLVPRLRRLAVLALIVINLASSFATQMNVIGKNPPYVPLRSKIVDFLAKEKSRYMSLGANMLNPDLGVLFGLRDFRMFEALYPRRFVQYMLLSGAKRRSVFWYDFAPPLGHLVDCASVRYIVTSGALHSEDEKKITIGSSKLQAAPITFRGMRLMRWSCFVYPQDGAGLVDVGCDTDWIVYEPLSLRFFYRIAIEEDGKLSCAGPWTVLRAAGLNGTSTQMILAYQMFGAANRHVVLQLADSADGAISEKRTADFSQDLGTLPAVIDKAPESRRFELVLQDANGARLYRNRRALPESYLVQRVRLVRDLDSAGRAMLDPALDLRHTAVIETGFAGVERSIKECTNHALQGQNLQRGNLLCGHQASLPIPAACQVSRRSPVRVDIVAHAVGNSWLIFTDSYYPGWIATVDGQPVPIYPANVLFRSVRIPSGIHKVGFEYRPQSFALGVVVAATTVLLWFVIVLARLFRRKNQDVGQVLKG